MDTVCAFSNELRDAGLLKQHGCGSTTWYEPTPESSGVTVGRVGREETLSSNPERLSSNRSGLSSNPTGLSSNPTVSTSDSDAASEADRRDLLNELPGELATEVCSIGQRHPPDAVREVDVVGITARRSSCAGSART